MAREAVPAAGVVFLRHDDDSPLNDLPNHLTSHGWLPAEQAAPVGEVAPELALEIVAAAPPRLATALQ
jgi:hypothetical protein